MNAEWVYLETDADLELMSKTLGVRPITAKVLANRGIRSKNSAIKFLNPARKFMYDAALLMDMGKAVSITYGAIITGKKITVYGDYDVDGVSGTVILVKAIRSLGGVVSYYIPGREDEGYGMNAAAVEVLAKSGTELIIACDNGISAVQEIRLARELNMDVVVIDHHEPGEELPEANAIIDHKRADCAYPFKHLCAAALCYKFAEELFKHAGADFHEMDSELLAFAGLATVCDIVSMTDENRVIAVNGLAAISRGISNPGLNALLLVRSLLGKQIGVYETGYIIGPCINAAGRLEKADLAVELFLLGDSVSDKERAYELAGVLSGLNDERKRLTSNYAQKMIEAVRLENQNVYVLFDADMPESIAGIVAGRVKDTSNHPAIVLTKASVPGYVKGSARSVSGYNIFEELYAHRKFFKRFGGHEMAAGLTMREEYIDELRKRLNGACTLTDADFVKKLYIDADLCPEDVTMELALELARLAPFGPDTPEPVFTMRNIICESIDRIGSDKKTLRFTFGTSRKLKGIAFGKYDEFASALDACFPLKMDIAFNIDVNEYNGYSNVQMKVLGIVLIPN
ncbi:MAG: single-stranded-DNA-specific exonuclease RecJ [Defluviitaleaceae bacterium]|nr:single-stranded-DNA-specific exonuclease RecJ [Defluviitaleaceae bacterium]MCL2835975.1 single-stranded-DNA-specific exonuclease RecJ [Defluviitaleaceae bacterium]